MKRINPKTNLPFKCGDIRKDGYIFQTYQQTKIKKDGFFTESWLSPKTFQNKKIGDKKWAKQNPEKVKTIRAKWNKKNLAIKNGFTAKRRANKIQATPTWLTKNHFNEIAEFYKMAKELEKVFLWKQEVDHIVPLQGENVSGLHVPWNLQILSKKENSSKGNKF
jgi:5-methylcytosine-specific restriction endonuclease McrA